MVSTTKSPPRISSRSWVDVASAERGQARTDGQRPGVAHEDLGRGRVPPEEPGTGSEHRGATTARSSAAGIS